MLARLKRWMQTSAAERRGSVLAAGAAQALAETAYLAVFRRPADPEGLAPAIEALRTGRLSVLDLLRDFSASEEFHAFSLGPLRYSAEHDPLLAPFRSPAVLSASAELQAASARASTDFEALYEASFAAETPQGEDYPAYHRRRFAELFNAAAYLLAGRTSPRVLEVGASQFTDFWPKLVPGVWLSVVDRPAVPPPASAHLHLPLDLNLEPMAGVTGVGEQDLVVYTEVLEHLQRNAVEQIGGLLRLLARPHGRLYLTTPNCFRYGTLAAIAWRRNPQPPLPTSNSDGHYHVREYCMSELLSAVEQAGGEVCSWHFSGCWDAADLPADELGNLVVTARLRPS